MPSEQPTYTELITQEKENPQKYFNKTFSCPKCGHCYYEGWEKLKEGTFIDDRLLPELSSSGTIT